MSVSKSQPPTGSKVLVCGAGNFGSCLADHLGDSEHSVYLWAREKATVDHFNIHHKNPVYLKDHQFSTNITAIGPELPGKDLIDTMDVLLFAIPTQYLRYDLDLLILIVGALKPHTRDTLKKLHAHLDRANLPLLIFVNKGIEIGTNALTLEIIADTCGSDIAKAATFIVSHLSTACLRPHGFLETVRPIVRERE